MVLSVDLLREKRKQLVRNFLNGNETEAQFLRLHSRIVDDYFCETFENSKVGPRIGIIKNPYVIIALGGYGREEQCIHSDIDLLLLFKNKVPPAAEDLIREVIYPLWDLGLEIGHATRSMSECLRLAGEDYEILTTLLDARFICGISSLYLELRKQVREKIIKKNKTKITSWLIRRNRERHERFGDSTYLLEPNLKEGLGGLRDYHTLLWIAKIRSNLKDRRDLEFHGYFSYDEYQLFCQALEFIWLVRNHLHHKSGRKCDQLHFEYQISLARSMGYKENKGYRPVEQFLAELHAQMEFIKNQHLVFLNELETKSPKRGRKKPMKTTSMEGLEIKRGMIFFSSPEAILNSPEILIRVFEESVRLKIPLSAEARRLVKHFEHLVDEDFRNSEKMIRIFEKILLEPSPEIKVLDDMLSTGFLVRFIPEYQGVLNRIQYDEYHLYPVDKHMLRTVHMIKKFGTSQDPTNTPLCGKIYNELEDRKILLWAGLLHDIGKAVPSKGHSERGARMARSIMESKGYPPEVVDSVGFLVKEHLFLVKTATRRDLNDEETSIICARYIKDPSCLRMLYLLSVADSIATGPKAWNDWTSTLLQELFIKVLSILEKGELASKEAMELMEQKRQVVLDAMRSDSRRSELKSLYNVMSPRYLIYASPEQILAHAELFLTQGDKPFVWEVSETPEIGTRTVTICAKDTPGLISKIAGVLTLNGIDILNVQVFTWRNNTALDIFKVKPPPDQMFEEECWTRAAKHLNKALSGNLDLRGALKEKLTAYRSQGRTVSGRKPRVVVDNASSSFFTIVEVFTDDFLGLLYRVTDALYRCKLDIWVAKIATKIDQVLDVFYVRDFDGQKVDTPEQVALIKKTILEVLPGKRDVFEK